MKDDDYFVPIFCKSHEKNGFKNYKKKLENTTAPKKTGNAKNKGKAARKSVQEKDLINISNG
jgi:hypothetical protein